MLVKHWQRVAETRFKYHKKIQMAVAGNAEILRWLRWLGAEISEPVQCGIYNLPHREFYFDERILKEG